MVELMRKILFKGKKKDNGEWIEGYLMDGGMPGEKRIFIGKLVIGKWTVTADEFDEVDPDTICEYTGLTDKNGKKIWENDIVEAWSQGSRAIGTVKQRVDGLWIMSPAWQNHEFWELKPNSNGETTVEVLGNAFDNPEYCIKLSRINLFSSYNSPRLFSKNFI